MAEDAPLQIDSREKQEEMRLRQIVTDNSFDFDSWLDLIRHVETYVRTRQNSVNENKDIYREFLKHYPQCYGFWRKLADISAVENQDDAVEQTYRQGLSFLPVCVELWMPFCVWKAQKAPEADARSLYEEAIAACGQVYTSNLLWDKYIEFEKNRKKHENVGALFWRLMTFPTCKLFEYFNRFKNWIESPGRKMEHYGARLPPYPDANEIDLNDPGTHHAAHDIKLDMLFSARCEQVKHRRIQEIIQQYERTNIENNKRRGFEHAIKRAFFHAKELEEDQLQNWRDYLEFEEREGDDSRIVLLYQRCIVATCYYAEFWVRYANYIQRVHGVDQARGIYTRANSLFLSKRPDLFLAQGHFEEKLSNFDEARRLYKHACEAVAPGLLDGLMRLLNLERRQGRMDEVEKLYKQALEIADDSGETALVAFVYGSFAKFQYEFFGRKEECLKIFEETLPRVPDRKYFYLASIQSLALLDDHKARLTKTRSIFKLAISEDSLVMSTQLSPQEKREMWESYLIFMRDKWENLGECEAEEKIFKKLYYHAPASSTNLTLLENVAKAQRRPTDGPEPAVSKRAKLA